MTSRGHAHALLPLEDVVAISLIRIGPDTSAARFVKDIASEGPVTRGDDLFTQLADRLAMPHAERAARLSEAREWARHALERASGAGISVLPWFDTAYPPWLGQIPDPPIVLWIRGHAGVLSEPAVALVGSRRASPAGLAAARRLGRDLAATGLVITSGLAVGVDGAAHLGALDAAGRTIGVLGSGLDMIYPRQHTGLAARIIETGTVVTEFPPGMPPLPHHFPMRNRVISGLSRAVVVIEASEKSGSLITARAALEQGRDVLAVPGGIQSGQYRGSHSLIKDGARLVETVDDVLQEIGWVRRASSSGNDGDKGIMVNDLERVMAAGEPYTLDDLAARTGRPASSLLADLGSLEVAGRVGRSAGGTFIRLDESAIGGRMTGR